MVTVATQRRGHHGPTVVALERGISVLCEKPIAIDLQEADEMVQAAERSGAKLAINQQNHVNPAVRKGLQMVQEGVASRLEGSAADGEPVEGLVQDCPSVCKYDSLGDLLRLPYTLYFQ